MRFAMTFLLFANSAYAETALQHQIRLIAGDAHGKVSVACSLPGDHPTVIPKSGEEAAWLILIGGK
jgi:hypothetical protein